MIKPLHTLPYIRWPPNFLASPLHSDFIFDCLLSTSFYWNAMASNNSLYSDDSRIHSSVDDLNLMYTELNS